MILLLRTMDTLDVGQGWKRVLDFKLAFGVLIVRHLSCVFDIRMRYDVRHELLADQRFKRCR
jgi:hypothetical protein